jgi:hypothetical protein
MNEVTRVIYHGEEEIAAAKARGEKLIEISPGVCRQLSEIEAAIPVEEFSDRIPFHEQMARAMERQRGR